MGATVPTASDRAPLRSQRSGAVVALCECGCGKPAPIAKQNRRGYRKGEPKRFRRFHHLRVLDMNGRRNPAYRKGRFLVGGGYVKRSGMTGHPRANGHGQVLEHILVAERALGGHLSDGAVVHHVNGVRHDNRPANLVICEDHAYHMLLHCRQRAFEASGHADWLRCTYCHEYDEPANLYTRPSKPNSGYHRACHAAYQARRVAAAKVATS